MLLRLLADDGVTPILVGASAFTMCKETCLGHEMSRSGKPRSRILRLRAIAHWFIRHLKPAGVASAPADAGSLFAPLPGEERLGGDDRAAAGERSEAVAAQL